jgi:hypothetical protein
MARYRDRDSGYLPPQKRDRPPTRLEWIISALCIVMAMASLANAFANDESAPAWVHHFAFGIAPIGVTELLLALAILSRSRADDPNPRFSPLTMRLTALLFFVLGAATIGVGLYHHFQGA